MWESQVRDLLKTTPRWQCRSTSWRVEQSSTSSGWCSDFFLLDIVKITVLMKLKSINHWMGHICTVLKSELRRRADSIALCTISSRHVSSANNLISHSILSIMSSMYIRKTRGPRIDPSGTPVCTGSSLDDWPSMTTLWNRFSKYEINHFNNYPSIPFLFSSNIAPLCHTVSKAFDMSIETIRISWPLSSASWSSCDIAKSW